MLLKTHKPDLNLFQTKDYTAKVGPVRIQYKCLIWNLIQSQSKEEIDYKD
jgi:hypothetical protein